LKQGGLDFLDGRPKIFLASNIDHRKDFRIMLPHSHGEIEALLAADLIGEGQWPVQDSTLKIERQARFGSSPFTRYLKVSLLSGRTTLAVTYRCEFDDEDGKFVLLSIEEISVNEEVLQRVLHNFAEIGPWPRFLQLGCLTLAHYLLSLAIIKRPQDVRWQEALAGIEEWQGGLRANA
jgi:hypothetical protein